MIRRPPRSTHCISSAASDVYKRQPLLEAFAGLLADGLSLLNACRDHTRDELIHLGIPDTTARDLAKLADTYFGQTAYTRLRDQTLTAIAENQHSLVTLLAVEKLTNQLKHSRDKWKLRHHATNHPGPTSAVCTAARAYCRGLERPTPTTTTRPRHHPA